MQCTVTELYTKVAWHNVDLDFIVPSSQFSLTVIYLQHIVHLLQKIKCKEIIYVPLYCNKLRWGNSKDKFKTEWPKLMR